MGYISNVYCFWWKLGPGSVSKNVAYGLTDGWNIGYVFTILVTVAVCAIRENKFLITNK